MRSALFALILMVCGVPAVTAQTLQPILQTYAGEIAKPSRKSVGETIDAIAASGLPQVTVFLEQWSEKNIWQRNDGIFFVADAAGDSLTITDVDTEATTTAAKSDFKQLKPNGGVRRLIGTALVQFQLMDPDLSRRRDRCSIDRTPPRSCAIGSFTGVNRWRSRCQSKSTKNSSWPTFYLLALLKIPKTALRRSTAFLRIHPSKLALC